MTPVPDLLGEVTGIGGYSEMLPGSVERELYGLSIRIIGLADLERAKAATGRAKDLLDLDAIRKLRRNESAKG